jgi:hypothetical protein
MMASALAVVSSTGHIHDELGKSAGLHEFEILIHASFHGPEDPDALSLETHQGAAADAAYDHGIYRVAGEGLHGLALAVAVVEIHVVDGLVGTAFTVYDHEIRGRPEVGEYAAFKPLILFYWKCDFHQYPPLKYKGGFLTAW